MESANNFENVFSQFEKAHQDSPEWLKAKRKSSHEHFLKLGLPTLKNEKWKYTNLSSLGKTDWAWDSESKLSSIPNLESFLLKDVYQVILIDGELQKPKGLPKEVQILPLKDFLSQDPETADKLLSKSQEQSDHGVSLLNDTLLDRGVFIKVPYGFKVEKPIHLSQVYSSKSSKKMYCVRNFISLSENSEAHVIESICNTGKAEDLSFINSMTDFFLEKSSTASYIKMQSQDSQNYYLGHTKIYQKENSRSLAYFELGQSKVSREDISIHLEEEHAESQAFGLFHTQNKHHVDYSLSIHHSASHTKSQQLFKGVADDESRGIFNATIKVDKDLKKINAHQLSRNLLLSSKAEIDAKPQLEIDSDDVKCAHGAAIGKLRPDEIFYLQTRGISKSKAEKMLVDAFIEEVLYKIENSELQKSIVELRKLIKAERRLPQ